MTGDTIFALSSGRPPAGIAVVRISGPRAGDTLACTAGTMPTPRMARLAPVRDPASGELLDRALILWMPGPETATGEDVAELHLHGGRAVVDGVLSMLRAQPGLRDAEAGEFTRRAFNNGRIDLNEAEGLADLLASETATQRRSALLAAGGFLSRQAEKWRGELLAIAAAIEATIDYSDEDDVSAETIDQARARAVRLCMAMKAVLVRPAAERMRDGVRIAVAGPPNSGKSSLINALAGRDVAIESPLPGTTRDLIEVPISLGGMPVVLIDTAGLREAGDEIEAIGIERARRAVASADVLLWLGDDAPPPAEVAIAIHSRADERTSHPTRLAVSATTGLNLNQLADLLFEAAGRLLPGEDEISLNRRQRALFAEIAEALDALPHEDDLLIVAEHLRVALRACERLAGRAGVEDMLDSLFARFCVGK